MVFKNAKLYNVLHVFMRKLYILIFSRPQILIYPVTAVMTHTFI